MPQHAPHALALAPAGTQCFTWRFDMLHLRPDMLYVRSDMLYLRPDMLYFSWRSDLLYSRAALGLRVA